PAERCASSCHVAPPVGVLMLGRSPQSATWQAISTSPATTPDGLWHDTEPEELKTADDDDLYEAGTRQHLSKIIVARTFTLSGAVQRIVNPSPSGESGGSPSGQSYMTIPPLGVSRNSSIVTATVGALDQSLAAVIPVAARRPYTGTGVTDVELVPGPLDANEQAHTSTSTGSSEAVTPSNATLIFFRSMPDPVPALTPRMCFADAADSDTTPPVETAYPDLAIKDSRNEKPPAGRGDYQESGVRRRAARCATGRPRARRW